MALISVAASLVVRTGLERLGQFYYLPLMPAVIATAVLSGRRETAFAMALCVAANVTLVAREGLVDTVLNAGLFLAVSWLIAEMCWSLRTYQQRTGELSHRLQHREEMLDAILASVPVVTLDRGGCIRFLTPQAHALLGAGPTVVGAPFTRFVEDFDLSAVLSDANPLPEERVWTCRREEGGSFPVSIHVGATPGGYEDDHAVLCLTDLTQAHAADARAQQLHAQLNRVWRLNSLGEMAASLAHELNQPLSAAATYLEASQLDVRKAGPLGESADRIIELAKQQLLRAGAIIRRMRELLAHETRSLGVEHVGAMIADMRGVLGMIEKNSGVRIEFQVEDLDDRVTAERIQFQQALVNLVRNAVEALQDRPDPRIIVIGRTASDEHYEIRVEDNGLGVAPEEMQRMFRPLMTTKAGGMSLGLSVTRTIVESHGGALTVDRSSMGGAAFSFHLLREKDLEAA